MKTYKKIMLIPLLCIIALFPSCQSTQIERIDAAEVPAIVLPSAPAAAEGSPDEISVPAAEEAGPYHAEYEYQGHRISMTINETRTEIAYPSIFTEGDAEAFMAYEAEKHPELASAVRYSVSDDVIALEYPETDIGSLISYADILYDDIAGFLSIPVDELPFGVVPIVKSRGTGDFDLFVVHTNDVHGRAEEGEGMIGYSKLSTLLDMARAATGNILLVDAGDTFHGTNFAGVSQGESIAELMDMLGYDAMAPGNHDFNYGYERLMEIDRECRERDSFRILSANITDESGVLQFQPYQVYDFNGFRVCVIGLTTPDTKTMSHPKNTEGLEFDNPVVFENAQRAVDLAHEIADYVIVLGHIGYYPSRPDSITSRDIAEAIDGIDLFIDGHSHTVMDGGERVNGTLIVSTGNYLENIGVVEIRVRDGEASESSFLIPAADVAEPSESGLFSAFGITSIPSDRNVDSFIAETDASIDEIFLERVAFLPMDLDGERENVRTRKTNLSKLITDAMTAESGADFSILNGGSIRASLKAGPVTKGDIHSVLPFGNIITIAEITPKGIYEALEYGYASLPEASGSFPQTDLKVVYSESAPTGNRIRRVYLGETLLDRTDDETRCRVATNDYLAAGGDGYTMFGQKLGEGPLVEEVFEEYLSNLYPL